MKYAQPLCALNNGSLAEEAATYMVHADPPSPLTPELQAIYCQIARELGFNADTLPPTLETAQVAVVLGVSSGTLEQWRSASAITQRPDNPVLPFQKIGRSLRYPVWHLAQFILQHTYRRSGERLFPQEVQS